MHLTVKMMECDIILNMLGALASGHILMIASPSRRYMRSELSETVPRTFCALLRLSASKDIGSPITEMVRHPHSLAHSRMTGTIPVPVPPPSIEKTTAERYPFRASLMASMFSKAMEDARAGSPRQPSISGGTIGIALEPLEFIRSTGQLRTDSDSANILHPAPPQATTRTSRRIVPP